MLSRGCQPIFGVWLIQVAGLPEAVKHRVSKGWEISLKHPCHSRSRPLRPTAALPGSVEPGKIPELPYARVSCFLWLQLTLLLTAEMLLLYRCTNGHSITSVQQRVEGSGNIITLAGGWFIVGGHADTPKTTLNS
jgi:hypothetical protein